MIMSPQEIMERYPCVYQRPEPSFDAWEEWDLACAMSEAMVAEGKEPWLMQTLWASIWLNATKEWVEFGCTAVVTARRYGITELEVE